MRRAGPASQDLGTSVKHIKNQLCDYMEISQPGWLGSRHCVACVASVSVRLSARSRHFLLFWPRENWGERKKCEKGEEKGEKETLARKPHDFEKRPFDTFAVG